MNYLVFGIVQFILGICTLSRYCEREGEKRRKQEKERRYSKKII